jgi:hypothetical protein
MSKGTNFDSQILDVSQFFVHKPFQKGVKNLSEPFQKGYKKGA